MPTSWDEFKRKYEDNIISLKPLLEITIYGSYHPKKEKDLLFSIRTILTNEGYTRTLLVEERQDGDLDPLEKSIMSLLFSDVNLLVFTKAGKRLGLVRELAFISEDQRMRSKISHCVVFDQKKNETSSSIPPLSSSDIEKARIQSRSFTTFRQLKVAIISEAYWQLRRLSPDLSVRR